MSFEEDIARFRLDAAAMPTTALCSVLGQMIAHSAELRGLKRALAPIVLAELGFRQSAFLDTAEGALQQRWIKVAPPARILSDGSVTCAGHRDKALSFLLGEVS